MKLSCNELADVDLVVNAKRHIFNIFYERLMKKNKLVNGCCCANIAPTSLPYTSIPDPLTAISAEHGQQELVARSRVVDFCSFVLSLSSRTSSPLRNKFMRSGCFLCRHLIVQLLLLPFSAGANTEIVKIDHVSE